MGLIFSIVAIVELLQTMNDPDALPIAVSSALDTAMIGGLLSAVGSFGYERSEDLRSRSLRQSEFFGARRIVNRPSVSNDILLRRPALLPKLVSRKKSAVHSSCWFRRNCI